MAEQTPAPTPSRSVYGFVVFLLFTTLFILYVLWAFIKLEFLEIHLGITDLPNKYFALFLPILVLTATTVFAFCIYPSLSFIMTPNIDSVNTITDSSSIRRCQNRDEMGVLCDNKIQSNVYKLWSSPDECDNHQNRESRIANYCDCTDRSKCMLASNKHLIEALRNPESVIQNSADLDIYTVNRVLYSKKLSKSK